MSDRRELQLRLLRDVARHLPDGTDPEPLFAVVASALREALGPPAAEVELRADGLASLRVDGEELDDGPVAEVEVPLRGEGLRGLLRVRAGGRASLDPAEEQVIVTLGDLLSGVLRQRLLFEQVLRQNTWLARLDDISREINTCREVGGIVAVASAGLRDLIGADAFGLYVLAEGVPSLLAWDGEADTFPQSVAVVGSGGRTLLGRPGSEEVPLGLGRSRDRDVLVELLRGGSQAALGLVIIRMAEGAPRVPEESRPLISALAGHMAVAVHNARLLAEMRRYATFDDLTELAGRRHFMTELGREIDRARRERRPLSMLMLDADHFKAVNDRFGHPAGDAVLRGLADVLREGTRSLDVAGRLGGEEFGVLLPGANEEIAAMIAERLRAAVAAMEIDWKEDTLAITISIGVAPWDDTMSPDDLVELSDQALYAAKDSGRNRVVQLTSLATVEMKAPS